MHAINMRLINARMLIVMGNFLVGFMVSPPQRFSKILEIMIIILVKNIIADACSGLNGQKKRFLFSLYKPFEVDNECDKIHFDGFAHRSYLGSKDCACQEGACCPD